MNPKKARAVTILFAVMLAGLDFCLWKVNLIAFVILTGALALFGYWEAARTFAAWLTEKPEEALAPVMASDADLLPEDFTATVEDIMAEMEAEREAVS